MSESTPSLIEMFTNDRPLSSDEMIQAVKRSKKLAAEVDPKTGNTPLHFACCNGAPQRVIDALLEVNPGAAKLRDLDGNLPITGGAAVLCL